MKYIFLLLALISSNAFAISQIQQQGIVTQTICTSRGVPFVTCLPLSSQVWDDVNGQLLNTTIAGIGGSPVEFNAGNSGASINLNFNNGQSQKLVLTGNAAITFSNASYGTVYAVRLVQDGTGSRIPSFPANLIWQNNNTPPVFTTTANHTDMLLIYYSPGIGSGAKYIANPILNYPE